MIDGIEWRVEPGLLDYERAVAAMEARADAIRAGTASELIWLVEHPPLYTAGTSAAASDVRNATLPIFATGRGGRHTYHGPGQRVVYVMLDLDRRGRDIRCYVAALENWVIAALADLGVDAFAVPGRVGIWTRRRGEEAKIGAIGVRVRRWITFHGVAVNVAPDLAHFDGIVPCGLPDFGVTSLADLGNAADMAAMDAALAAALPGFIDRLTVSRTCNRA